MEETGIKKEIDDLIKLGDSYSFLPTPADVYTDECEGRLVTRSNIEAFQSRLLELKEDLPGVYGDGKALVRDCPGALITHEFVDGIYIRQMDMKPGCLVISAVHKHKHVWFLMTGHITVTTENGKHDFIAPCRVLSPPGIKRVIYANEPSLFINVHKNPSETRDIDEVEDYVWALNYEEYEKYIKIKKQ